MVLAVEWLLLIVAVALATPTAFVLCECLAVLLPAPPIRRDRARPRLAVLIPAHNEQTGISTTLESVLAQTQPGDEVLVVADNCTDQTARVADRPGVRVIERTDPHRRGKGFALDFGVQSLRAAPPDAVVILDADCRLEAGALDALAYRVAELNRPLQGRYLMLPPAAAGGWSRISTLAFFMKGPARAGGLERLGLPCLLGGTGMIFPWPQLADAPLASANLVEDMQLGLDLAIAGHAPRYCSRAVITSDHPESTRTSLTQRTRWEHGHLATLLRQSPRLLLAALRQRRPALALLALELAVPPLALLVLLLTGAAAVAASAWLLLGISATPLWILASAGVMLALAVAVCWLRFARRFVPLGVLLGAPLYALAKIPLYLRFVRKPEQTWVRTERSPSEKA